MARKTRALLQQRPPAPPALRNTKHNRGCHRQTCRTIAGRSCVALPISVQHARARCSRFLNPKRRGRRNIVLLQQADFQRQSIGARLSRAWCGVGCSTFCPCWPMLSLSRFSWQVRAAIHQAGNERTDSDVVFTALRCSGLHQPEDSPFGGGVARAVLRACLPCMEDSRMKRPFFRATIFDAKARTVLAVPLRLLSITSRQSESCISRSGIQRWIVASATRTSILP